jgi:glutathione S-transferase
MTDGQNDAVLETLRQIAADQTDMQRNLQKLVRRVTRIEKRIEERFDDSNARLRRIGRLRRWRDGEHARIADHAAAPTRPAGKRA